MTVSFVTATRYLGPVGKGVSGSQFFDCDDSNAYLVKFFDRRKTVINELVGGFDANPIANTKGFASTNYT